MQMLITSLKKIIRISHLHISVLLMLFNVLLKNMFIKMKTVRQDRTRQGSFPKGAVEKVIQLM